MGNMANNLSFNLDRTPDGIKRIERNVVSAGRKIRATNCASSAATVSYTHLTLPTIYSV